MKREYDVMSSDDLNALVDGVNVALTDGWRLIGAMTVNVFRKEEWFYQTLYRETDESGKPGTSKPLFPQADIEEGAQ